MFSPPLAPPLPRPASPCCQAERFWSAATVNDVDAARPRLHEFRYKMVRRGIPASPIASLSYNEGGPYHVAFCRHDSDSFTYTPPAPFDVRNA